MWFIYQIMAYMLLTPALYALIRNRIVFSAAAALAFIFASKYCQYSYLSSATLTIYPAGLFYYALGSGISIHFRAFAFKKMGPAAAAALGIAASACFVAETRLGAHFLYMGYTVLSCLFMWQAANFATLKTVWGGMRMSFYIYALHIYIAIPLKKLLVSILPSTPAFSFLSYALTIAASLGLILLSASIVSSRLPFVWSLINGGRGNVFRPASPR